MSELNLTPSNDGGLEDVYEVAMNEGHAAAWDQDWERAIPAYMTAIRARPDDAAAHNNLGLALLEGGRHEDAFKVYQRAAKLAPDDPVPLEKSADVLERMGRLNEAAKQYLQVAEIHLAQQNIDDAISNWERATHISGGLVEVHKKLARAYERTGRKRQAVREYMTLAGNYQMAGNTEVAVQAVERALRIEPSNPQAMNALQALRSGSKVIPLTEDLAKMQESAKPPEPSDIDEDFFSLDFDSTDEAANEDGPIGEAVELALESLATHVMETGQIMEQAGMLAIQAIDNHNAENFEEAIDQYKKAQKAGLEHDGVYINIGALSIALGKWKDAIKNLEKVDDSDFLAGAQHGLGIANWQLKDARKASKHLIQTLKVVEVGLQQSTASMQEVATLYDELIVNSQKEDAATLTAMNERFFDLLTGADWKRRISVTRQTLQDAMGKGGTEIIDAVSVPPVIMESMRNIDQYLQNRRYTLAMDEAYHVIEQEPEYIAAHMKIGEILVQLNRIEQAVKKYNSIARTYLIRGNRMRAGEVLSEIIKAAPTDISVRMNLIDLLEEEEAWDKLLPEYIYLGDAYAELADYANAKETYMQAIEIARKLDAPPPVIADIMHKSVDLDMMRLDVRSALKQVEQIRRLSPQDTKARDLLIDIHFRLGNPQSATEELDGLLQIYASNRNGKAIVETLQRWVKQRPDDEAIRSRMAAIYHQIKQTKLAIEHYNYLLNLQLNNGRHEDACATLKTVLTLNPPNVERYQQLQQQLGCN